MKYKIVLCKNLLDVWKNHTAENNDVLKVFMNS